MASLSEELQNTSYLAPFSSIESQVYGGQDFPDGLIISPLDSDFAAISTQTVRLSGTRMPFMPFEWGGEMLANSTTYAGKNVRVIQPLSCIEDDLVIEGIFSDYAEPANENTSTAASTNRSMGFVNYFEELWRSQQMVLLSLNDRYTDSDNRMSYSRYCFLKKPKFSYDRISFIRYTLTFLIASREKPFYDFFAASPQSNDVLNSALKLSALAASLEDLPTEFPDANKGIIASIQSGINTIVSAVATVTKAIETVGQLAEDITNVVNNFIGIIDNAIGSIARARTDISGLSSTIADLPNQTERIQSQAAASTAIAFMDSPSTTAGTESISPDANVSQFFDVRQNQENAKQQQLSPSSLYDDLIEIKRQFITKVRKLRTNKYTVMDGDTLGLVAFKVYGNMNKWPQILTYNQLQTAKLTPGQELRIP